jgi:hypothetical protein
VKYQNNADLRGYLRESGHWLLTRFPWFRLDDRKFHRHVMILKLQHKELDEAQREPRAAYRMITSHNWVQKWL